MYDDEVYPWSDEDMEAFRTGRPKRIYHGPSVKETKTMYGDSPMSKSCPDCHRVHVEDHLGTRMGRCFSCFMHEVYPGKVKKYWDNYDEEHQKKPRRPTLSPMDKLK